MLTAGIPALKQGPLAARAQRKMRVLQHAISAKERIKCQARCKDLPSPDRAGGRHEIHLAYAAEWRLHVCIDGITHLEVISAGFECAQQSESLIPAPAFPACQSEV